MPNTKLPESCSDRGIDFSTVLASTVHDMKNSLALVLQQLESVIDRTQDTTLGNDIAHVHYEAQRINANLVQLLQLYPHQQNGQALNIEHQYLDEIIEEVVMNNELYLEQRGIELTQQGIEECTAFCDRDLTVNLLNDIVINAMRYTADKLVITAQQSKTGGVTLSINDNGPGYPQEMLDAVPTLGATQPNEDSRTGLGLYFAQQIAEAHERNGKKGYIELQNGGQLGGSVFKLVLP